MILFLEKNNALCPKTVQRRRNPKYPNKVSSTPSNNVVPPLLNELPLTLCKEQKYLNSKWRGGGGGGGGRGVNCFVLVRTTPFEDSAWTILLPIVVALSNNSLNINCFHVYVTIRTRY